MRHICQPEGSNMCGQAIIAMLGNMTLYDAIEFLGTKGGTGTKIMVEALRAGGFKCGDRLKRMSKDSVLPSLCIVHIRFKGHRKAHWSLWNGFENLFYDPAFSNLITHECFYAKQGARITSYLEIKRKK